ncbi:MULTISPECIES: hypothetical protein [Bacillus cereus group]|uniref:hypothetical protein n=1 Tax=Bacillus cereus group TaxID=86661 RepID=UPI0022E62684|nr:MULTISPECIES: hypothetical protein [Bacillus cereus group]MDA1547656.1 hypothetical protein [Bacillus cereus group sp. TH253LC]MDE7550876.1 hypothetical protein [Bacillus tropicus]MDE7572149.1 hypothetical protein [Bacillus tropicus]
MSTIKDFIPFIIPILTAVIGYIVGQKTHKVTRFFNQSENNLKTVIEPLFLNIKLIKREESSFKKEQLLNKLFESYLYEYKGIYQIGNKDLIDAFLRLEELYYDFKKEKTEDKWIRFWIELEYFYKWIEKEYWSNFYTLYKEYKWYLTSLNRNIFVRITFDTLRFFKDFVNFLSSLSLGFIFFSLYDKFLKVFFNNGILPEGSIKFSIVLLVFCIALYTIITVLNGFSPDSSQKKDYMDMLMSKQTVKNKKFEQQIKIPKMYK